MTITYSNKADRLTKHLVQGLCTGWITYPEWNKEVLWAETPDGKVLRSNPLTRGQSHFFLKGRAWEEVKEVPADAEYCGQYKQL